MSGNEIICKIDMTALEQIVYVDNHILRFKLDMLYKALNQLCYSKEIYTVHLFGNEDFIDGIMSDMFADEMTQYGDNKIKVEVN